MLLRLLNKSSYACSVQSERLATEAEEQREASANHKEARLIQLQWESDEQLDSEEVPLRLKDKWQNQKSEERPG